MGSLTTDDKGRFLMTQTFEEMVEQLKKAQQAKKVQYSTLLEQANKMARDLSVALEGMEIEDSTVIANLLAAKIRDESLFGGKSQIANSLPNSEQIVAQWVQVGAPAFAYTVSFVIKDDIVTIYFTRKGTQTTSANYRD